jgi:galactose mutarotase-like enzyme
MRYRNIQSPHCHGPRVLLGYELYGSEVVILENELLRVVVNAGRGAMIHEFLYKPADLDVLFKNPGGLRPLGTSAPSSYDVAPLMDNHPGGWYECFPSGSAPVKCHGASLGFHGEIFGLPFEVNAAGDGGNECSATMTAFTVRTPWKLTKTFALKKNDPTLYLRETATNLGAVELPVHWGQHPMFGAPFLDERCRIEIPAGVVLDTHDDPLVPRKWPLDAKGADLSAVRGPESRAGKMVFATELKEGRYRLISPTWQLAFEMRWDARKFPYCWLYENAGQMDAPWFGRAYTLALEPFTGLPKALETGRGVLTVPAGQSEMAAFEARIGGGA